MVAIQDNFFSICIQGFLLVFIEDKMLQNIENCLVHLFDSLARNNGQLVFWESEK